ncbi:phage holin family protein [Heyndrickxia coagulans]|uniref:phage holin family protein n=1 Tax=Heyndrickxia coagulans TaxID=1398 RepID=UPI001A93EB47|nr:phage holin family protein [Heyndrickxia coagulans]
MDLLTAAFAVIGFLCVMAFFVFFSFGFSKKGVVVLAGTAFLLALFGILAGNVVPLWESGLIVFLLVLCVAYLFEKKLAFLFAGKDNDADEFPVWDEQEELAVMRENRPAALVSPAANDAVLPAEKSAPAPEMEEILPGKNGPGTETESTLPEEKDEPEWEELEDAAGNETGTALPANEQAAERSGEEEIDFLENRLELLEEVNEENKTDHLPEMYEVEEWVAEAESPDAEPLDGTTIGQDSEVIAEEGPVTSSGSEDVQYVEQEEIPLLSFEKKTEAPAELSGTDMPAMDELEEIDVIPFRETDNAGQREKLPSDAENETVGGAKGEDTNEPEEIGLVPVQETNSTEQSVNLDLDAADEAASGSKRDSTDGLEEIDEIPFHETDNAGQREKLPSDTEIEIVGGATGEDTDEPEEIDVMPDKETGQVAEPEKFYSEAGQGRERQGESGAGTGETVAANEAESAGNSVGEKAMEPKGNPAVEEASDTLASVPNGTMPIQKQLLGVLLEQLNLYRRTQPADAYEQLVKAHLHPQLAPEDYFTFASLLVEHYIAEQQFGKLQVLLKDLAETYAEYPVIREEIDFLRTKYGQ